MKRYAGDLYPHCKRGTLYAATSANGRLRVLECDKCGQRLEYAAPKREAVTRD